MKVDLWPSGALGEHSAALEPGPVWPVCPGLAKTRRLQLDAHLLQGFKLRLAIRRGRGVQPWITTSAGSDARPGALTRFAT